MKRKYNLLEILLLSAAATPLGGCLIIGFFFVAGIINKLIWEARNHGMFWVIFLITFFIVLGYFFIRNHRKPKILSE
jgi:hypothetical protein